MDVVRFDECNIIFAKDQPQYRPFPAYAVSDDEFGEIVCCWKLNDDEIKEIVRTGVIWHHILTFKNPLQPQRLSAYRPNFP